MTSRWASRLPKTEVGEGVAHWLAGPLFRDFPGSSEVGALAEASFSEHPRPGRCTCFPPFRSSAPLLLRSSVHLAHALRKTHDLCATIARLHCVNPPCRPSRTVCPYPRLALPPRRVWLIASSAPQSFKSTLAGHPRRAATGRASAADETPHSLDSSFFFFSPPRRLRRVSWERIPRCTLRSTFPDSHRHASDLSSESSSASPSP